MAKLVIGISFSLFFLICSDNIIAQVFTRIEAEFSVKEKDISNNKILTMGKVYYDKIIKKVVFNITFPNKIILVIKDSIVYQFVNDSLTKISSSEVPPEFMIYHLALNGNLDFFGLKQTPYILTEVEKDEGMIISSWILPKSNRGKIMLSQKDKRLFGMISYNPDGDILSKQFFESYVLVGGLEFPSDIIQFMYVLDKKIIKQTTYRNILVNEMDSDSFYDYPLPVNR